MKRRQFFQALSAVPAAPALLGQPPQRPSPAPAETFARASGETPKLDLSVADAVADPEPRFFSPAQFAALRKLSDLLMPAANGFPGALAAGAPEFLDFLAGASDAARQAVYRQGLDLLNAEAGKRYGKSFAEIEDSQAEALLAPLRQTWTFEPPAEPLAHFLQTAKQDVRTATINSREWAAVAGSSGARRMGGVGLYWYPLD